MKHSNQLLASAAALAALLLAPPAAAQPQSTGIPIIEITTVNSAPINSKEVYTAIESISITDPSNQRYNISRSRSDIARPDIDRPNDEIRGRGNATWAKPEWGLDYPKKPYRLRFNERVSLFGLDSARNWILLAEYRDPSYIFTPITFYVAKNIFQMPFTHNYFHVHLYVNSDYRGLYGLTEHKQVNPGRIDIDPKEGWHVNIDGYYEDDPKFKSNNYNLPIMIKSPEPKEDAKNINNPEFQFVKDDWNELTRLMNAGDFPNNGYRDLIDMRSFIDYLLVSEIIRNWEELSLPNSGIPGFPGGGFPGVGNSDGPKSVQAYKDKGGKMSLGPLWDFDCGFGYNYQSTHQYFTSYQSFILKHPFLTRLYDDPVFKSELRKRWEEKYEQLKSATTQIDAIAQKIRAAVAEDTKRWYNSNNMDKNQGYVGNEYNSDHAQVTNNLKNWWTQRLEWLNNSDIVRYEYVASAVRDGGISKAGKPISIGPSAVVKGRILSISSPSGADLKIRVIDVRGKTIAKFNASGSAKISLTKIPAGRYFIDMRGTGIRQTSPVTVK